MSDAEYAVMGRFDAALLLPESAHHRVVVAIADLYQRHGLGRLGFPSLGQVAAVAIDAMKGDDLEAGAHEYVEWCAFAGGEHPDDAATVLTYDDEGHAWSMVQWLDGGRVAFRVVRPGPWSVSPATTDVRRCESGCDCRYGTEDPDRLDCGCDGPCTMAADDTWGMPQ